MFRCAQEDYKKMIAIIRIAGKVKIKAVIEETLQRLRMGNKFTCVIIDEKDEIKLSMLKKVKDYVAYGEIDKSMLVRLIEKRGQLIDKNKKIDAEKIADEIISGKKSIDLGIKPFFRLHPPRHGLKSSKKQFPRGVLGNHKDQINKLIEKML